MSRVSRPAFAPRRARAAGVLAPLLLLAGCGGGLWIGLGGVFDDLPPEVQLASAASVVQAGQPLHLVAAAADESGIDEVAFYRLDGNEAVRLGSDGRAPYEWDLAVPADGRRSLTLFARATDGAGNRGDSAALVLEVRP